MKPGIFAALVCLLLLAIIPTTFAGFLPPVKELVITVTCEDYSVVFGPEGEGGEWTVDISEFGGGLIASFAEEGSGATISNTWEREEGDRIVFEVRRTAPDPDEFSIVEFTLSCSGEESLETTRSIILCNDGRLNVFQCEPLAIFPIVDEEGFGMVVYRINRGDNAGYFSFELLPSEFGNLPEEVSEACVITASADGFAVAYLLPTGEIQINAGPDEEGKIFVYRFEAFPGIPSIETYFSNDALPTSPSCNQ